MAKVLKLKNVTQLAMDIAIEMWRGVCGQEASEWTIYLPPRINSLELCQSWKGKTKQFSRLWSNSWKHVERSQVFLGVIERADQSFQHTIRKNRPKKIINWDKRLTVRAIDCCWKVFNLIFSDSCCGLLAAVPIENWKATGALWNSIKSLFP